MPGFKRNSRARRRVVKVTPKAAKRITAISIPLIVICAFVLGWKYQQNNLQIASQKQEARQELYQVFQDEDYSQIEGEKYVVPDNIINIVAVGNIICEPELCESLYDEQNDNYQFLRFVDRVRQYVEIADYTVGALKTNFVDYFQDVKGKLKAPKDLGLAMKDLGIDLVSTAHNHSNDYGKEGIEQTIDYLDSLGIKQVGTNKTSKEQENITIVDIRDIKVAFLAYTEKTNIAINTKEKYLVNKMDKKQIVADMQKAKEEGAEFIFVCLNWGEIDGEKPTKSQQELAKYLVDNGADFILGSNPEMVGNIENYQNKEGKNTCIVYSMGNFLALGKEEVKMEIALDIEITKSAENGQTYLSKVSYTPIYLLDKGEGIEERYFLANVKQEIERYEAGVQNNLTQEDYNKIQNSLIKLENRIKGE